MCCFVRVELNPKTGCLGNLQVFCFFRVLPTEPQKGCPHTDKHPDTFGCQALAASKFENARRPRLGDPAGPGVQRPHLLSLAASATNLGWSVE